MLDSSAPVATTGDPLPGAAPPLPLRIGGTDHGPWMPLAEALVAATSVRLGHAVSLAPSIVGNDTKSRWLLLIERPDTMLARWQQTGTPGQMVRTLDAWCVSASAALVLAVARGRDVLLLRADVEPGDAAGLAAQLGTWDARLAGVALEAPPPAPVDPLALAIAQRVCRARPDVRRIYDALRAHAPQLPEFADAVPPAPAPALLPIAEALPPPAAAQAAPASVDASTLLQRLHETQHELELVYLELQEARSAHGSSAAGRGLLRAGHARLVQPDEAGAGLLLLELRQLDLGMRVVPRARAALVRDRGQPGVRLYASGSSPEVVSAWQPTGSDDHGPYMQFVPALAEDRRRLQFLGAADWRVVSGMVALLRAEIETMGDSVAPAWRLAGAHLARLLDELPPRFRYDGIAVTAATAPDGSAGLDVKFSGAGFGGLQLGTVWLQASGKSLWWKLDAKPTLLPLAGWPIGPDGDSAPQLQLPVGALAAPAKVRLWQSLSEGDRDLLLAVLDALPASVPLAPPSTDAGRLREAFRGLQREARRTVLVDRLRRRVATLPGVGRLLQADRA